LKLVRRAQTAIQLFLALPKQLFSDVQQHDPDGTRAACKPHGRQLPISRHAATHLSGADAAARA
jgi:hypothetical protein